MLQLRNAKYISPVLTGLAAIIVFSSYFGVANRVKATEVRHPTHQHDQGDWLVPTGKGWGQFDSSGMSFFNAQKYGRGNKPGGRGGGGSTNNGIFYHGGPVIYPEKNVYFIWYGNWPTATTSILADFGNNIAPSPSGSPYFNINSTYSDGNNNKVANLVQLKAQLNDTSYSFGTDLSDANIQSIVSKAIGPGTPDPDGVYFVLTSADVNETSGFCTMYCGWHAHATINGTDTKYAFVGDPTRCPSACEVQTTGPNGSSGADGMANIIAHELAEAATDPDLNAWYDRRGYENADKCVWTFGSTSKASNGSLYNVTLGTRNWLLQQNWVNANGGGCVLAYP